MPDSAPVTQANLLDFIKDFVVDQFRDRGQCTNGPVLADAIRDRFPGLTFEQVGFGRLADAVTRAEQDGLIRRNRQVLHLEVLPGPASGIELDELRDAPCSKRSFLRPEIWRAFIFVTTNEQHYMDRVSGRVLTVPTGNNVATQIQDANAKYIGISVIPIDVQKSWMRNFIEEQKDLSVNDAPFDDSQWWTTVPLWLRQKDPSLEKSWRRDRSRRVLEFAKTWARENNIPYSLLFETSRPKVLKALPVSSERENIRQALLAALKEMPLHELEDLSIPVHYLIRHFRVI